MSLEVSSPLTPVLDDATRADENPISNGGGWSASNVIGVDINFKILSNAIAAAGDGTSFTDTSQVWGGGALGDQEVWCRPSASGTDLIRLWARINDENSAGTMDGYLLEHSGTALLLWRYANGVSSQIGPTLLVPSNASGGETCIFRAVECKGGGGTDLYYVRVRPSTGKPELLLHAQDGIGPKTGKIGIGTNSPNLRLSAFGGGSMSRDPSWAAFPRQALARAS